jgi:hypothetical protein
MCKRLICLVLVAGLALFFVGCTKAPTQNVEIEPGELIHVDFADEDLLLHGDFHHYTTNDAYAVPIALYVNDTIEEVSIFTIEYGEAGPYVGAELVILPEITKEKPLVAELDFPGSLTTYGIRFADKDGEFHFYNIQLSGEDGSIVLTEE